MNLQGFSTSRLGVGLSVLLGQLLPLRLGYYVAQRVADGIVRGGSAPMLRAVRANQKVVRGGQSSPAELEAAAAAVFRHAGRCSIDLNHNLANAKKIKELVPENPRTRWLIERSQKKDTGIFLALSHMSNFDLAFLALGHYGLEAQVLSYSRPTSGYQLQNRIRTMPKTEITPISERALHQARLLLKRGGVVVTGIDRPIESAAHPLTFFGRPAYLPTAHVRMALAANVPVVLASVEMTADGKYDINLSDPILMQHYPDRAREIRTNAETILTILEGFIRRRPDQWLMFYPVWPETVGAVGAGI